MVHIGTALFPYTFFKKIDVFIIKYFLVLYLYLMYIYI